MGWVALLFGEGGWMPLLLKGAASDHRRSAFDHRAVRLRRRAGARAAEALSRSRAVRGLCHAYTTFFRGIPDLLALFIVYFGLQALFEQPGGAHAG